VITLQFTSWKIRMEGLPVGEWSWTTSSVLLSKCTSVTNRQNDDSICHACIQCCMIMNTAHGHITVLAASFHMNPGHPVVILTFFLLLFQKTTFSYYWSGSLYMLDARPVTQPTNDKGKSSTGLAFCWSTNWLLPLRQLPGASIPYTVMNITARQFSPNC